MLSDKNLSQNILKKFFIALAVLFIITLLIIGNAYYEGKLGQHYAFRQSNFQQLPHWQQDNHLIAFNSFQISCNDILKQNPNGAFSQNILGGNTKDWQKICVAAKLLNNPSQNDAKNFFEKWFVPYHITNNYNPKILFTGYYLPLLHANYQNDQHYKVPVYSVPTDLIEVKLKNFKQEYRTKKSLYGQLQGNKILPYPDRAAINQGAINNSAKILLWANNAVDLFFLQIQGSGLVELPDGQHLILGYAGSNGRPYTSIGNFFIRHKIFTKENVSMQSMRSWFEQHPDKIDEVLNKDQSYIFFRLLDQHDPIGSERVPLTPGRSLAVDTHLLPLGAPIWVSTAIPTSNGKTNLNRLFIAQDTGGAIIGMHCDTYWGAGDQAAFIAGNLKNQGQLWVLLPRNIKQQQ